MNFDDLPPQPPRKSKFKPKVQPRKIRPVAPKREPDDDDAGLEILKRFQEIGKSRKLESSSAKDSLLDVKSFEPTSSAASSFGTGTTESYGADKMGYYGGSSSSYASKSKFSKSEGRQKTLCLPSPDIPTDDGVYSDPAWAVSKKVQKDYVEPWDYTSYYPTSLPLRKPYSGSREILDAVEFGENQRLEPDESVESHASELGLLEACEKPELFLVQLPQKLPVPGELNGAKRPNFSGSSTPDAGSSSSGKQIVISPPTCRALLPATARNLPKSQAWRPVRGPAQTNCFEGLPAGHIGKMLVYKSGKVKWKIGETVFDVAPGIDFDSMAQDVVAMNAKEGTCCEVGKLEKKMNVIPDVDFLLDSIL